MQAMNDRSYTAPMAETLVSAFAGFEKIMTRKGAVEARSLKPGDEVLTTQGFRVLIQTEPQAGRVPNVRLRGLPTADAAGFRGDPRKLMLAHGAAVELITGMTRAMLRLSDLADRYGVNAFGPAGTSVILRFAKPELIITEQGCFASQDHESLPPLLVAEEAAMFLSILRSRGRHG
jgi:hypothetical protein